MASHAEATTAATEELEVESLLEEGDTAGGDRPTASSPPPPLLSPLALRLLLLLLALVVSLPLLLLAVLTHTSLLSSNSSHTPQDSVNDDALTQVPFQPPPLSSQCLCSSMYPWATPLIRPSAFPNRLPWHLSRAHSYAQWEECPMWANRSVLLHQAPALSGPFIDREDSADDLDIWQLPPCLLFEIWLRAPDWSYRTPVSSLQYGVFDQQEHVLTNLFALLAHADKEEPFEVVVVFDDCTDQSIPLAHALLHRVALACGMNEEGDSWTEEELPSLSWRNVTLPSHFDVSNCIAPALVHIRTLVQPTSIWETASNNLGARAAHPSAEVLIFIQDDVTVETDGWNVILALPTRLYADVVGVTGRCAHPRYSVSATSLQTHSAVGRCTVNINDPLTFDADHRCMFYIRDTINRGPLLIVHDVFREMGYFDEVHFHMDDSDHDFFTRLYEHSRQVGGFMPFDFIAPLAHASGQKVHPPLPNSTRKYLEERKQRERSSVSRLHEIAAGEAQKWVPHDEDRRLAGHFQRCLEHYRSNGEQTKEAARWWKPLPRWIEGGEDA